MDPNAELERGRELFASRAWADAYEQLSAVDRAATLEADDLELLADSAYMVGHDEDYVHALERAHHAHAEAGEWAGAARCGFWLGLALTLRGERARGAGWFSRAERELERAGADCVERGYLLVLIGHAEAGEHAAGRRDRR